MARDSSDVSFDDDIQDGKYKSIENRNPPRNRKPVCENPDDDPVTPTAALSDSLPTLTEEDMTIVV